MPSAHLHGGAEESLIHLLRNREAAGLSSVLIVLLEEGELKKVFENTGTRVEVVDSGRLREPWKIVSAILKIHHLVKQHRADLVLGWMTKAHIYGGPAAMLAGVPAIYCQLGLPDNGPVDRLARVVPAAGALTPSDFAAKLQQALVRHPVIGVPPAADFPRFSEAARQSPAEIRRHLGLDVNRPIVGIVGRMQRWKGMHVFVEAMARVFQKVPDCEGVIVGGMFKLEPEYEPWLRRRVKELGMEEKIRMVGMQRNVPDWMSSCMLRNASRSESSLLRRCHLASLWWQLDRGDPRKSLRTIPMDSLSPGTSPMSWQKPFSSIFSTPNGLVRSASAPGNAARSIRWKSTRIALVKR